MQFCSKCNSRMKLQKTLYVCLKCGHTVHAKDNVIKVSHNHQENQRKPIYVINNTKDYPIINKNCPHCGNQHAFHWSTSILGEHSGIRQERTVEHYKCTECMHTWAEVK